jgi:hypothetical protein
MMFTVSLSVLKEFMKDVDGEKEEEEFEKVEVGEHFGGRRWWSHLVGGSRSSNSRHFCFRGVSEPRAL